MKTHLMVKQFAKTEETYTVLLKSKVTVWQYKFSRNKDWVSRWKIEFQETVN